jgi:hypothetical protein
MKSCFHRFNTYLALAALLAAAGCASKADKFAKMEQSTIRFYTEGNRADATSTGTVLVGRGKYPYNIEREPFLTEADVSHVAMIDEPGPNGGYAIELGFDDHGALALEMATTLHKNGHIIIYAQFPSPGAKAPKNQAKPKKSDEDEPMQMLESLPAPQPELEKPGQPRTSAWLAAVLIKERNTSGLFRFSPDASREETARIVRGLKNDIAYERMLEQK